jgi:hypothetical protein
VVQFELAVIVKAEIAVKPNDVENLSAAISDHRLHALESECQQSNIIGNVRRYWTLDRGPGDFLGTHAVMIGHMELNPCHGTHPRNSINESDFLFVRTSPNCIIIILKAKAKNGLLSVVIDANFGLAYAYLFSLTKKRRFEFALLQRSES